MYARLVPRLCSEIRLCLQSGSDNLWIPLKAAEDFLLAAQPFIEELEEKVEDPAVLESLGYFEWIQWRREVEAVVEEVAHNSLVGDHVVEFGNE